jgi:hypothetical protein
MVKTIFTSLHIQILFQIIQQMLQLHQKLALRLHSDVILYYIPMGKAMMPSYKRFEQLLM